MKNLIIVCDEKRREFADYLSQLISSEDDTSENTVGVKDGTVAAQVWLEKEFVANSATISSNQYILFIGESKLIKEKSAHMKSEFCEHGIKCSWLGKQALVAVDKVVEPKKYDEFLEYAKKYETNLKNLMDKKSKTKVLMPVAFFPVLQTGVIPWVVYMQQRLSNNVKKQMYSCAVMKFYLEDLNKFLGLEQAE